MESKICVICNRPFQNRKKWKLRNIWDQIKYCSKKCRKISRSKNIVLAKKTDIQ